MKILLLGSNGQLGWELIRTCPENISLTTCDFPKVDFCSSNSIEHCINANKPDCIINAAAYTPVDKAEQEKDLAYRINHLAVLEIAELCKKK
jgi:dTDP-4-dehydrorhamnose reductase